MLTLQDVDCKENTLKSQPGYAAAQYVVYLHEDPQRTEPAGHSALYRLCDDNLGMRVITLQNREGALFWNFNPERGKAIPFAWAAAER